MTSLELIDERFLAEFRGYIADAMLTRIVCFSAEPYFQSVARDLAAFRGVTTGEACDLLLVTSRAIVAAAETEAQKHLSVREVRNAA